jgi:hypothetical protein
MFAYNLKYCTLLLSNCPCFVFKYYKVNQLHGLNYTDCIKSLNESKSFISGWCNQIPNNEGYFIYINLNDCKNDTKTTALVFHELMHLSFNLYDYDLKSKEEEIISFAENETYKVVDIIKIRLNKA